MTYGTPEFKVEDDQTDRIGIRTLIISKLWQPTEAIEQKDLLSRAGPDAPKVDGGLAFIGRQTLQMRGSMKTIWTFEGIDGDGKSVTFKDRTNSPDYEFQPGFAQVSILQHPDFRNLREKYQGQVLDGEVIWPDTISGEQSSKVGIGGRGSGELLSNPLFGVRDFLRLEGTYLFRYASRSLSVAFSRVGRITNNLPGVAPRFSGRNWLKCAPAYVHRGTIFDITETYWLSGEKGWPEPIYGSSNKGQDGGGLVLGRLEVSR